MVKRHSTRVAKRSNIVGPTNVGNKVGTFSRGLKGQCNKDLASLKKNKKTKKRILYLKKKEKEWYSFAINYHLSVPKLLMNVSSHDGLYWV